MRARTRTAAGKQRGTLIVALMAGIAILMILSTVAVQNWGDVVRRDNEAEMMFRAQDIVRAIKRFQADKGKLPNELKELMEPGNKGQFFLRKLWKDPLVKGGQWQLVYAAPGGGILDPTVPQNPQQGGAPQTGLLNTGLSASDSGGIPSLDKKDNKDGSPTDPTGLPIAGVKTKCKDRPFRKYKEKTEYTDWIFSIFDNEQRQPSKPPTGQTTGATFPPQSLPQTPPQVPPAGQPPN